MMKRLVYIDYMKGWGILLIMFAHCMQCFYLMSVPIKYVTSFYVPIFFVAAGCLAYHKKDDTISLKEFVKKRFYMLLIPYIVFSPDTCGDLPYQWHPLMKFHFRTQ